MPEPRADVFGLEDEEGPGTGDEDLGLLAPWISPWDFGEGEVGRSLGSNYIMLIHVYPFINQGELFIIA